MEPVSIGSPRNPSFSPTSTPGSSRLSPFPSSGVHVLKCRRWRWNNVEKQVAEPLIISPRQLLMRQQVGFSDTRHIALSPKASDDYLANAAAAEDPFESEPSKSLFKTLQGKLYPFYHFSRPYAFIGRVLSISSFSLIAVEKLSDISPLFLTGIAEAIAATFFMHLYINGLNQLADIEIDKINKPYLPLASGELSVKAAVMITYSSAIMSFWLGWGAGSWPLFCALLVIFVFGTAYSINVPFLRWKSSAFLAALCIFAMRVPTELSYYLHMQTFVFGRPAFFSKRLIFATAFMSNFSVAAALFKDIPDVSGDKLYGIRSFAVRLGRENVFWICISLFQITYLLAMLVGLAASQNWSKFVTVASHIFLAWILWSRAKSLDLGNNAATLSFYMFLWKLLYAECCLMPLIR